MSRLARDSASPARGPQNGHLAVAIAVVLSVVFVALTAPVLATLPYDFDEGWLILDARLIQRGLTPFVDFPVHEPPLHPYLLALSASVFGPTLFGYRMLSLLCLVAGGLALFALARPFVGTIPALAAQTLFLFSPVQVRALAAVPETSALPFTLIGAALLFTRDDRWSAAAGAVAFVAAILIKPTCLVMALAAAVGLAWARRWSRLVTFAATGTVVALAGLAWVIDLSDGIFGEVLRFQLTRVGTHRVGMWGIDSGFADMRRQLGIATPRQWAVLNFATFFRSGVESVPLAVFWLGLLAIPLWALGCARSRPAFAAFVVLWPTAYLVLNFVVMDFVSPRYFIPCFAFATFLCAGWVWLAERYAGRWWTAAAATVAGVVLAVRLASMLQDQGDLWFWGRVRWIADHHPKVASFNPIFFAATGAEPACGLGNPALAYGAFGEAFLWTERTRALRVSDEHLVECLRANPDVPIVVDWAFYFFTRPDSRLRAYLAGDGSAHRLFFSPESVEQWDRPLLRMSPFR